MIDLQQMDEQARVAYEETCERFAFELHQMPDLTGEQRLTAMRTGVELFGAQLSAWYIAGDGSIQVMIDTREFGCLWVWYRRAEWSQHSSS